MVKVPAAFIDQYDLHLDRASHSRIEGWVHVEGAKPAQSVSIAIPELKLIAEAQLGESNRAQFQIPARNLISVHAEAPHRTGRASREEDVTTVLGWAQEPGYNFVRLAHYPHDQRMTRAADRLGILVWSEIPVYWAIQFDNPAVLANATQQLTEEIRRDRNKASISSGPLPTRHPTTPRGPSSSVRWRPRLMNSTVPASRRPPRWSAATVRPRSSMIPWDSILTSSGPMNTSAGTRTSPKVRTRQPGASTTRNRSS